MLPLHNYTFLALAAAVIVRLNSVWQFLYQRRPDRLATNPPSTGVTKEVGQVEICPEMHATTKMAKKRT